MRSSHSHSPQAGYAIVLVVLLLASLLTLALPFLFAVRSQADASAFRFEDARAGAAVETAEESARGATADLAADLVDPIDPVNLRHGDTTPRWDDENEIRQRMGYEAPGARTDATGNAREQLLQRSNPAQVIWDADLSDERSRLDLNTAPPIAIATLLRRAQGGRGWVTRLSQDVKADETQLFVGSTEGFPEQGILWIGAEIVRYAKKDGESFLECERGTGVPGASSRGASDHTQGAVVLDERAHRIARWRTEGGVEARRYLSVQDIRRLGEFDPEAGIPESWLPRLVPLATVHGEPTSAGVWTRWVELRGGLAQGTLPSALAGDLGLGVEGHTIQVARGAEEDPGEWPLAVIAQTSGQGPLFFHRSVGTISDEIGPMGRFRIPTPVNLNTAPRDVLVACFHGVWRRNSNPSEAIDERLAEQLADLIVALRSAPSSGGRLSPFQSWRDYVERFLDPLARVSDAPADFPELELGQRLALYLNASNPLDAGLQTSTVPFCFDSGDIYRAVARASSNSPAGVTRRSLATMSVFQAAPPGQRFAYWSDQRDFEQLFGLSRGAHWMTTGPEVQEWLQPQRDALFLTSTPSSRAEPHLTNQPPGRSWPQQIAVGDEVQDRDPYGTADDKDERRPWVQLQAVPHEDPYQLQRISHFAREPRVEGRDTGSSGRGPERLSTSDRRVGITTASGRLWPFSIAGWFRPRNLGDQAFFEIASDSSGSKRGRLGLSVEGSNLVFRLYDGQGDDPITSMIEAAEVRIALGDRFQLEQETWYHFRAQVRGGAPRDLSVMVDGFPLGKPRYVTWLTSAIGPSDDRISVDNTDGFPTYGLLRIGDELVEYRSVSGKSFLCSWQRSDAPIESAWTGGRGVRVARNANGFVGTNHDAGTLVELAGYVALPTTDIPKGGGTLDGNLSPFGVARVVQGSTPIIVVPTPNSPTAPPISVTIGKGLEATDAGTLNLQGLTGNDVGSFQSNGGIALLVQRGPAAYSIQVGRDQYNVQIESGQTQNGTPLLGMEVIRYSSFSGGSLNGVQRNYTGLQRLSGQGGGGPNAAFGTARAFVTEWQPLPDGTDPNQNPRNWLYIVPLSVKATQADATSYLAPQNNGTRRVQIYTQGQDGNTEWVEYDEIHQNMFVRSDPSRLAAVYAVVSGFDQSITGPGTWPQAQQGWIGGPPQNPWNLASQRIHDQLAMRGRYGTFQHQHTSGAQIHPVIATAYQGFPSFNENAPPQSQWSSLPLRGGRPGRGDRISLRPENGGSRVFDRYTVNWTYIASGSNRCELAFKEPLNGSFQVNLAKNRNLIFDSRDELALVKFPSGELPDGMTMVRLGEGTLDNSGSMQPLNGLIDEVEFDGLSSRGAPHGAGDVANLATYVLADPLPQGSTTQIRLRRTELLMPYGSIFSDQGFLASGSSWPQDAGVIRIGEEFLAYSAITESSDGLLLTVARQRGRGFLGSKDSNHGTGDPVHLLSDVEITELTNQLGMRDDQLQLENATGFWTQGTVLIDDEVVHYTRNRTPYANQATTLSMPRTWRAPRNERSNGYSSGAYRGRYGTSVTSHSNGSLVYRLPFRYWDRTVMTRTDGDLADQGEEHFRIADLPGNAYLGFAVEARDSFFQALHWKEETWGDRNLDVWALVRVDGDQANGDAIRVPWDAVPVRVEDHRVNEDPQAASDLFWMDTPGDRELGLYSPINRPGSRLEGRVFFRYRPGAFRLSGVRPNSWKRTPYLEELGVLYQSANRLLYREQRP